MNRMASSISYFGGNLPCRTLPPALCILLLLFLARVGYGSVEIPLERLTNRSLKVQEETLTALLKQSKDDPYLMRELGRVVYRRGKTDLALKLWKRASDQDQKLPPPEVELVFIDLATGNTESAKQRLQQLNYESSKDAHVLIAAGELALLQNDAKTANDLLNRALDLAPHYPSTNLTLGHLMEVTRDFETAEFFFQKVTELEPERAPGWLRLAALYFRQDKMEDAFRAYQEAEKCKGTQPLAQTRMGEAFFRRGDYFAAYQYFRNALKRDPKDAFPGMRLGQIFDAVGRKDEAQRQYQAVVNQTEYPETLKLLAEAAMREREYEKAADYYRRALQVDGDDWVACNNLAMLIVQMKGSASEAVKLIDHAIELNERPVAALRGTRGCVLWYAGQADQAEGLLAEAVVALPSQPWTRYCYGKLLLERKPKEALPQLQACLFLDADFARKDEVADSIRALRAEEAQQ